jgi:hypothetical protein
MVRRAALHSTLLGHVAMVLLSNSNETPGALKHGLAVKTTSFSWNTLSRGVRKNSFRFLAPLSKQILV